MKVYTLTSVWNYDGEAFGICLGVYPTEEQAQKAMKKNLLGTKEEWIKEREDDFKIQEQPRMASIISLVNSDCDMFIIAENEMEIPSGTAQENG